MRTTRFLLVLLAMLCPVGRAFAQQTISCNSDDGKKHYCQAETRAGVQMARQRSGPPCTQGVSWDYDDRGLWVDKGCRADFLLAGNAGPDQGGQQVTCSSKDGGRQHCPADTHGGVQMVRQISGSSCVEGRTWGFDQSGIWVDKGCGASFMVGGSGPGYGNAYGNRNNDGNQPISSRAITCSSNDGRRNYCNVETSNARITMSKQISGSSCVEGTTWGFDNRGIWVDKGCRANFLVLTGGGSGGPGAAYGDSGAQGRTCTEAVGAQRANQLAQQCLQVSPATHPPCNAQNTCKLITDEIKRSCPMLGRSAPGFCDEYR
jgi:Protein of unknown function (DUF3011)